MALAQPQRRLAERMASLSLAMNLGTGQPMEWLKVIRCTLIVTGLSGAGHEVGKWRARAATC